MIKLLTVIGARPQIIKAAALSRAIRNKFQGQIIELILHTGQHYDENMSGVFFGELEIPPPVYNLRVGSGSHGRQTAAMISGIEEVLLKEKPNGIVLYGDTNSTLAGAIAASKLKVPVIHIEAGLRSFNKAMPEEINRILCDHVSTLLFSPTRKGVDNLAAEGFKTENAGPYSMNNPRVVQCGDVMFDNSLYFSDLARKRSDRFTQWGVAAGRFGLVTIHRDSNTDQPERLTRIFDSIDRLSREKQMQFIIPLHPRTSSLLEKNLAPAVFNSVRQNEKMIVIPPVSFLEMTALEMHCSLIMTDSGGVQKESHFFKKPCIILRPETEWIELVENGTAVVCDADPQKIREAFGHLISRQNTLKFPPFYGDGRAAEHMCGEILKLFGSN